MARGRLLTVAERSPEDVLARLDAIALQTPRTMRLDGSPEDGLITWVTRSAVFGFPDYTTAAARSEGPATFLLSMPAFVSDAATLASTRPGSATGSDS